MSLYHGIVASHAVFISQASESVLRFVMVCEMKGEWELCSLNVNPVLQSKGEGQNTWTK